MVYEMLRNIKPHWDRARCKSICLLTHCDLVTPYELITIHTAVYSSYFLCSTPTIIGQVIFHETTHLSMYVSVLFSAVIIDGVIPPSYHLFLYIIMVTLLSMCDFKNSSAALRLNDIVDINVLADVFGIMQSLAVISKLICYGDVLMVNSPHQWPVTRKRFPFDDVIMFGQFVIDAVTSVSLFIEMTWSDT